MSTEAVPPNAVSHMDIEANLLKQAQMAKVAKGVSNTELEDQMRRQSGQERRKTKEALIKYLQHYFSRRNLHTDTYLRSQMSNGWVPVDVIATFKLIREQTGDKALLIEAMKECKAVTLNEDNSHARAQGPSALERTTLILREISSDTPTAEVRKIFEDKECAPIKNLRSDIGNTWFVTFDSEDDCIRTAMYLQNAGKFKGNPIQCRVKSENVMSVLHGQTGAGGGYAASARSYQGMGSAYNSGYNMGGSPTYNSRPYRGAPQAGFHPNFMGPPYRPRTNNRTFQRRPERDAVPDNRSFDPQRSSPNRRRSPDKQASRQRGRGQEGDRSTYPKDYKHYSPTQIADVIKAMMKTGFKKPKSLDNAPKDIVRSSPLKKLRLKLSS